MIGLESDLQLRFPLFTFGLKALCKLHLEYGLRDSQFLSLRAMGAAGVPGDKEYSTF